MFSGKSHSRKAEVSMSDKKCKIYEVMGLGMVCQKGNVFSTEFEYDGEGCLRLVVHKCRYCDREVATEPKKLHTASIVTKEVG